MHKVLEILHKDCLQLHAQTFVHSLGFSLHYFEKIRPFESAKQETATAVNNMSRVQILTGDGPMPEIQTGIQTSNTANFALRGLGQAPLLF